MLELAIDLYRDWNDTVKEIFRGSGYPLPDGLSDKEIGIAYFMQTAQTEEEAEKLHEANEQRIRGLQQTIQNNFEPIILPDIQSRTGYTGTSFSFKWVYNNGEHIIEEHSAYRIPL
ncbi:hypothetical protein [Paenibacillus sp. NPDC058174]|uniref:hypothetical protein n=1 Tax=Paenibacillus sp. NPDC058174 TaxID=3346366 RepID=UPI0036DF681D